MFVIVVKGTNLQVEEGDDRRRATDMDLETPKREFGDLDSKVKKVDVA